MSTAEHDSLAAAIAGGMEQTQADLEALVRIPSIAFAGYPDQPNHDAAELTARLLRDIGLPDVEIVDVPGAPPAVIGRSPGVPGAKRVLLYAHYDVQPPGPEDAWTTPAFEPTVRNGRLHGRGAADDKSGVVMHVAALRALGARPGGFGPLAITVLIEGDEETGQQTVETYLADHRDEFEADVIVVADSGNWKLAEPTLATSLRGLTEVHVEVSTLERPAHSGLTGGGAPDALLALIRILDSLTDADGDCAVEGLSRGAWTGLPMPEDSFRAMASMLDGVPLVGTGDLASRLYSRPNVTVIGLDAPSVATAANALVPRARAKVSVRLAPGDDPVAAFKLVSDHLRAHVPWGVRLELKEGAGATGWAAPETPGPGMLAAREAMAAAYGKPSVDVGSGGSIPLVTVLADTYPGAEIITWGAQDDDARIHAGDEGVVLRELERAVLAEALFLVHLETV